MKKTIEQIKTAFESYLKCKGYIAVPYTTQWSKSGVSCIVADDEVNLKDFSLVQRKTYKDDETGKDMVGAIVQIRTKDFDNVRMHQNLFRTV